MNGADFFCKVRDVSRNGDLVRMHTECVSEGAANAATMEMTYNSGTALRQGEKIFKLCE